MADKTCTGSCLQCSFQQQTYCAAQRSYLLVEAMKGVVERLGRLETAVLALSSKEEIIDVAEAQRDPGAAE